MSQVQIQYGERLLLLSGSTKIAEVDFQIKTIKAGRWFLAENRNNPTKIPTIFLKNIPPLPFWHLPTVPVNKHVAMVTILRQSPLPSSRRFLNLKKKKYY